MANNNRLQIQHSERTTPADGRPRPIENETAPLAVDVASLAERVYRLMLDDLIVHHPTLIVHR